MRQRAARLGYSYTIEAADPGRAPAMTGHARGAEEARGTVEDLLTADPALAGGVVRSLDLPGLGVLKCSRAAGTPGGFDWVPAAL